MQDPLAASNGEPLGSIFVEDDQDAVGASLHQLMTRLVTAVPSFLGLTVRLVGAPNRPDDGLDLSLTAAVDGAGVPARTSLAFSVARPGGGCARFTLYAHQPGALVDLQADITYLGDVSRSGVTGQTPSDVRLDRDHPAPALEPGLLGLAEQSVLQRAEGVLIDQGVRPERAASELRDRADRAGSDRRSYARRLLAEQEAT